MESVATLVTILVAGVASVFMAWAIGAGSSGSTPFAPAVGANAISVMQAGFVVGILGFLGAVIQGANVSETIGGNLIHGVTLSPMAATTGLVTAAILVAIGIFAGYPIATAFTVTGAVVGVGLALGGDPAWAKYQQIVTLWVLTPFVGGGIAYVMARLLGNETLPRRVVVPGLGGVVGVLVANIQLVVLAPEEGGTSLAALLGEALNLDPIGPVDVGSVVASLGVLLVCAAVLAREISKDELRAERRFLLVLGGLVAFSAGGSQVGLAIGPMIPLLTDVPIVALLVGGGAGLLVGSWTAAPRMIKALAQDYASLDVDRSIAALIPSFAIAQTAVLFGIPVSFNEIIVSAIVGSGLAGGSGMVSRSKMLYTIGAWVASLAVAIGVGYGAFSLATFVL